MTRERLKVLIIDDDPDVRKIAQLSLTHLGRMEVVEASSAAEGVERAACEKPDVILLDFMMPKADGMAAAAALRREPRTAGIPVIFLTARAEDAPALLRKTGAVGLLNKPFDPTLLAGQVRALLGV